MLKSDNNLIEYIKSRKWGNFDNKEMFLLIRSIQLHGFRELRKNAPRKMLYEDVVILHGNQQLKAFSLLLSFSKEALDHYFANLNTIEDYINRSYLASDKANKLISRAKETMAKGDVEKLVDVTKELIVVFFEVSYWKYYISTLSSRMYSQKDLLEDGRGVLEKVYSWKNNEEYYNFESNALIEISHFLASRRGTSLQGWKIVKFLHLSEFLDFLDEKISEQALLELIGKREEIGCVSLGLEHPDYGNVLLCNSTGEAQEIKRHIDSVFRGEKIKKTDDESIRGLCVVNSGEAIQGECVVILSKAELKNKVDWSGKILVASMVTPEFTPYIENVKAIITDTGGMLSHVAIVAREFGIPGIIGTNVATTFLKTGDAVELDMKKGIVRKVSSK